jgi:hypothetical protein
MWNVTLRQCRARQGLVAAAAAAAVRSFVFLVPSTAEIEELRPRSPAQGGAGRGRGR